MGRRWSIALRAGFAIALVVLPGCTAVRLKNSVLQQTQTLTDLQYMQVLNNIAMFYQNPFALPSQVTLADGSAQIADSGAAGILFDIDGGVINHPTLSASRTAVQQWGMSPIIDDTALKLLQLAYQRAIGFEVDLANSGDPDDAPNGFANTLAHQLKDQISPQDQDLRYMMLEDQFEEFKRKKFEEYDRRIDEKLKQKGANGLTLEEARANVRDAGSDLYRSSPNFYDSERTGTNDEFLITQYENLSDLDIECVTVSLGQFQFATPTIKEVRRLVKETQDDLRHISSGWCRFGARKDVPKDACYVGHCGDRYVWVCPDGLSDLSRFTLKILSFSTLIEERQIIAGPGSGPRYSPAFSQPSAAFLR
jgi:hypothetical protein